MWRMWNAQAVIFVALLVMAVAVMLMLMLMLLAKRQGETVYPKMRYAGQGNIKIAAPLSATTQASEIQTTKGDVRVLEVTGMGFVLRTGMRGVETSVSVGVTLGLARVVPTSIANKRGE
jgi:lipopolysaccharide/colanic/teichoic acid biosynthesis glycosyltransferase